MRCICCDTKIALLDKIGEVTEEDTIFKMNKEHIGIWDGGIVHDIAAGYGSCRDGNQYVIAVCDKCIEIKTLNGTVAYIGDYMAPDYYKENEEESARKIWRRYNQLDNLLDEK